MTGVKMIKLELTIEEVNTILASLGKHPFEQIFQLMNKIQQQGAEQVKQLEAEQANKDTK